MLKRRSPAPGILPTRGVTGAGTDCAGAGVSRRDFIRASGIGGLALAGLGSAGSVQPAVAAEVPGNPDAARRKTVCPFCSVGCSIWAEVENGVWVGQEPVFESPINQGTHCCKGASAREVTIGERRTKYPMKKVGGQWQRISWEQAIQEIGGELLRIRDDLWPGQRLLAGLGQVLERNGLSVPQVRRLLGHQQRRPPGAHLPLDHRRRRRQHLRLRRHDEQLQRHPALEVDHHHRRQPGRGAPRLDAARAERPRERRADDRRRPALHAHRGACRRVRPHPAGHGCRLPVRGCARHPGQWLGGQGVPEAARLGFRPHPRGDRPLDAGGGRARHGHPARAARARRAHAGREPARHADLVHGPDAVDDRQQQDTRRLDPAACARQHRQGGWRRQHLPRPRQRAGRDRSWRHGGFAAGLLRAGRGRLEALGARLGRGLQVPAGAVRLAGADERLRHPRQPLA